MAIEEAPRVYGLTEFKWFKMVDAPGLTHLTTSLQADNYIINCTKYKG